MQAKDIAEFVMAQDQEIHGLQARVKWLEDGLKRMVTCGDAKASAMAWNILNEVAKSESQNGGMAVKMFVWNDPYDIDYGGACIFALGKTEEDARIAALAAEMMCFGRHAPNTAIPVRISLNRPADLILESGAVCYTWSE